MYTVNTLKMPVHNTKMHKKHYSTKNMQKMLSFCLICFKVLGVLPCRKLPCRKLPLIKLPRSKFPCKISPNENSPGENSLYLLVYFLDIIR